jgi:DNA polymerase-4
VTLKIRFTGFETHTRQHSLGRATHDERVILREAWRLFLRGGLPRRPVRLIGVGLSRWGEGGPAQAELFAAAQQDARDARVLETIDRAAQRFGSGIVQLGCAPKKAKGELE